MIYNTIQLNKVVTEKLIERKAVEFHPELKIVLSGKDNSLFGADLDTEILGSFHDSFHIYIFVKILYGCFTNQTTHH